MQIKILNPALARSLNVKVHTVLNIYDIDGVPVQKEWRNRLCDAKLDNCVEVVKEERSFSKSKKKEG